MSDSTVRVLFLGDSVGAQKASKDLERAMSGSFKSVQKNAENATSSIVSGFQSIAKTAAKTALITGGVITASIAGGLVGATAEAIHFDAAMRNVNSIAGLSEKRFQGLSKQVLSLSKSTGQGPTTLAKGLYDIVSSGFKASQAIGILKQSAIAATAGLTDTATASNAIVASLNSFQIPARDANKVASVLFETVNKGVVSFPQLAAEMGTITGLAPNLGVSLQEATAAFAELTLHGGDAATHATQVRAIFSSLMKPTKDLSGAIHSLGFENANAALKTESIQTFLQGLATVVDKNGLSVAKLFPNVRALAGFLGLTGANAEKAQKFLDANNKAYKDGTAQTAAFKEQQKSIATQWNLTKAGIEAAAVPLGKVFFPALRDVLGEAAKFGDFLNTLNTKKTITAKLDFVWDSIKGVGQNLWRQLSDAITGDSTKKVFVGSQAISFRNDGQGLASKFWNWFSEQVGTTPTHKVVVGGSVIEFKRDATLRDQLTSWVSHEAGQIDWGSVGKAMLRSIPNKIAGFEEGFSRSLTRSIESGISNLTWSDVGKGIEVGGKILAGMFIASTRLALAPFKGVFDVVGPQALAGIKAGAGKIETAGKNLATDLIHGAVSGLADLATFVAAKIDDELGGVPGAVLRPVASFGAQIGGEIISAMVSGLSGLGGALLSEIESAISSVHIPTPHINTTKIHIPGTGVGVSVPTGFSFADGGALSLASIMDMGGKVTQPMIAMGEEAPQHPEFVIPTNPARRGRARGLLSQAASALGVRGYAAGGTVGGMPREKHARKSPNRPLVRTDGAGAARVKQPIGAAELAGVVSAANKALAGVTSAQQAVDDATSNYDLTSRSYDQIPENFLLDVPDDPSDPTNTSTHQVRNEADITQRLQQLSSLEGLKSHIVDLIAAQKSAAEDAVAKLKSLIAELLADIRKLQAQIAEAQKQMKAQNAAAAQHIKNETAAKGDAKKAQDAARIDRGKIATERLKPKKQQDKGKIAAWESDANKQDGSNNPSSVYRVAMGKAADEHAAAHQSAQEAKASKANIDRLTTMIGNRTDRVKDYNDAISTQQASLQPPQLPANIRSAQLDLIDLQNEAASVNGTTGTNAAPSSAGSGAGSASNSADLSALQAQLAAEEAMNQQLRNALGLGVAQSSVIGAFVGGAQGFAKGSLYVPDTGLAWVHRGEQIQTAAQSVGRDSGGNAGPPAQVNVIVADGMGWLKEFIRVEAVGASDQIAVAIGGSSDMRSRGLGF